MSNTTLQQRTKLQSSLSSLQLLFFKEFWKRRGNIGNPTLPNTTHPYMLTHPSFFTIIKTHPYLSVSKSQDPPTHTHLNLGGGGWKLLPCFTMGLDIGEVLEIMENHWMNIDIKDIFTQLTLVSNLNYTF